MTLDTDTAKLAADTAQILDVTTEARRVRARATQRHEPTPNGLLEQFGQAVRRTLLEGPVAQWLDALETMALAGCSGSSIYKATTSVKARGRGRRRGAPEYDA